MFAVPHVALCSIFAATCMLPSWGWSADVHFSQAIKNITDGGIVVEAGPGDVLVFDGGVYHADGRNLVILADATRIEATTIIYSHAPTAAPPVRDEMPTTAATGANGGSWGCSTVRFFNISIPVCNHDGDTGSGGTQGVVGHTGKDGGAMELAFGSVTGTGTLLVVGNGEQGGQGQKGGKGGTGGRGSNGQNRAGDIFCNGQNRRLNGGKGGTGGLGGRGGRGGPGGSGSVIHVQTPFSGRTKVANPDEAPTVYSFIDQYMNGTINDTGAAKVHVFSVGGEGGPGGVRGDGGDPGQGGRAGGGSHCGGGGDPGRPGSSGAEGSHGTRGSFGSGGLLRLIAPAS